MNVDKKFLKYIKNTCLDFENSLYKNNDIEIMILSLKDILKNKKLTLKNSQAMISYLIETIENETNDKQSWLLSKAYGYELSFNEYLNSQKEIKKEWVYMYKVFKNNFDIKVNKQTGLITINNNKKEMI